MIGLFVGMALLGLGDPDPEEADEIVRTAREPAISAEAVVQGESVDAATDQDPPPALTTDQQIQRWLAASPAETQTVRPIEDGPVDGVQWDRERRVRGEFTAGIGTGGYREFGASVSVPLGDRGHIELHYRDVENDYRPYGAYGYGPYNAYGDDPDWPDVVVTPWRSTIDLEPIDARLDNRPDRGRAFRDYGRRP